VLASVLALSTLSFVSLLVPVLWLGALRVRPFWRRLSAALVLASALFALQVHPLEVRIGSYQATVGRLHPQYMEEGLGPKFMPVWTVQVGPVSLSAHATAYFYLARQAVACWLQHPWWGIGPNTFSERCQVMSMDTYGNWVSERPPHNQYFGLLAEEG